MPLSVKTSATVTKRKKMKSCLLIKKKISFCVLSKCFHELLLLCPSETWSGTKGSRCNYFFFFFFFKEKIIYIF